MSPPSVETTMAMAMTKSNGTMAGMSSSATATASGLKSNKTNKDKDKKATQKDLKRRLQQTMKSPGNKKCCDCHDRRPTWASFIKPHDGAPTDSRALVCFVCYQCASLHRKLGTHICSVRSVSLDDWNEVDVESSELSGNTIVNYIYEANWEQMNKDNPAAEISRPAQGAHGATVERFIRQKYETKMFYNKAKHYDHNFDARQKQEAMAKAKAKAKKDMISPTPKSPSARKRLGAFLEATVRSPIAIVGKLSGSRSVGLGGGDGTGTTEESSVSDNKSFFSVPALSSDAAKKKRGTRKDRHGRHHRQKSGSSSSSSHHERHSHQDKLKMHQSFSGSSGSRPRSGMGIGVDSSGPRRSNVDLHSSTSWLDSQMPLKGGESENEGDGSKHNTTKLKRCSNHSQDSNGSSDGGSESGGGLLKKTEKKHMDPRRRSFHESKSGGFDFSSSDLDFSSDDLDLGDSQGNLRSGGPNTPRKPKLVSSTLVGNEPSPHNSRMNLYTHKQKQNGRGRSRSHSRTRDSVADAAVNRSRSKSRLRGENGDERVTDCRQRRNVGRSRSRGPTTDERRERYGGRSRSSSRVRDGNNESFTERASRRVSERRGRSRSIVRDQDIVAGAAPKVKRDGRSSSRLRSSSKAPDSRETRKSGLNRQRSVRRSKSEDLTDLARMATSNKELGRVDPKTPLERAKSDDLSGMVLVLDESTNEIAHEHHKSPGKHKRRSFKSLSKNEDAVRRSSRKIKSDDDDVGERPKSGRSHGHSEGQGDWGNSSKSLSYDENDDDKVERPRSRRSRGHSERQREWGNSSTSLSYDEKDGKSEERPRSRRSNGNSERRRSRDWGNSSKSLNYDEKDDEERPLSRRSNGHSERRKDHEMDAGISSPSRNSSRRGRGSSRSLKDTATSNERSRSHSRNRNNNDEEEKDRALKDAKPRRGRRDNGSERNSTRSIRTYLDQQADNGLSCPGPASSRSMASKIVSEKTNKEESEIRTPKDMGRRSSHKSKAFKSISLHESSDTGESPRNSGEKDFQVIKAKPFALGGGSDHSFDSFQDSSNFHTSFSRDVGKDRFIKEARRCSRDKRVEKTNQRMSRKSDIFASLDREENEASATKGPLAGGLRRGVARSKSGVGATKLMLRAPPKRSKSSDGAMLASNPRLDLGVELGKGSNNDALMKAWKARKEANEKYLAQFDSSVKK